MNKRQILLIFCAAILLIFHSPVTAAFDKGFIGNARYIGLSGAYVGMSDDESAVFANPAGLIKLKSSSIGLTGGNMYAGLDFGNIYRGNICTGMDLSSIIPSGTNIGMIGIGFDYYSVSVDENVSYNETLLILSYARNMSDTIGVGINLKIPRYSSDLLGDKSFSSSDYWMMSIDIGIMIINSKNLSIGAVLYDINEPNISANSTRDSGTIPFSSKFGISYSTLKQYMILNVDAFYQGDVVDLLTGLEIKLKEIMQSSLLKGFILRTGLMLHEFTEGIDFSFGGGYLLNINNSIFQVDYAFKYPVVSGVSGTIGSHFLTTSYRFGTADDHQLEGIPDVEEDVEEFDSGDAGLSERIKELDEVEEEIDVSNLPKETVTIYPAPEQDGFTGRSSANPNDNQDLFRVGDHKKPEGDNDIYVGFIGFDLSSIPDGAIIRSAKVYLKAKSSWSKDSTDLKGNSPFYIDHCDFGDTIDQEDVDIEVTGSDLKIHTWKEADVEVAKTSWMSFECTASVKADYKKNKSPSRYRIRPNKVTQDDERDNIKLYSVDMEGTEHDPYLEVVYSIKK